MEVRRSNAVAHALARARRRLSPGAVLAIASGLFAYRALLPGFDGASEGGGFEHWFFAPEERSPLLLIGVAGWLLWRRRARLLALPAASATGAFAALLGLGVALFAWGQLASSPGPLCLSLAANLLAFAAATRGLAGCRAVLLPSLLAALAMPIPVPLRNELVWQLQNWTAGGSAWLLEALGGEAHLSGLVIASGEYTFTVIESCSGLRGIEILALMALIVRELFASGGARQWLLLVVAIPLGYALNVLRVVLVILTTTDPAAADLGTTDHTPQGMLVLVGGTVVLYVMGLAVAAFGGRERPAGGPRRPPGARSGAPGEADPEGLPWRATALVLALLAALSLTGLSLPPATFPDAVDLPMQRAGWLGEDLELDRDFVGRLPRALYRRYARRQRDGSLDVVELFVGREVVGHAASGRLFSPKASTPGRAWSLGPREPIRLWLLSRDAELAVAARGAERMLVLGWRIRDEGLWREAARSLLAMESGPFRREPRAVVRLAIALPHDGPVARDRARRALEGFIADFREPLAGL